MNQPPHQLSKEEEAVQALSLLDEAEQAKVIDYINTLVDNKDENSNGGRNILAENG